MRFLYFYEMKLLSKAFLLALLQLISTKVFSDNGSFFVNTIHVNFSVPENWDIDSVTNGICNQKSWNLVLHYDSDQEQLENGKIFLRIGCNDTGDSITTPKSKKTFLRSAFEFNSKEINLDQLYGHLITAEKIDSRRGKEYEKNIYVFTAELENGLLLAAQFVGDGIENSLDSIKQDFIPFVQSFIHENNLSGNFLMPLIGGTKVSKTDSFYFSGKYFRYDYDSSWVNIHQSDYSPLPKSFIRNMVSLGNESAEGDFISLSIDIFNDDTTKEKTHPDLRRTSDSIPHIFTSDLTSAFADKKIFVETGNQHELRFGCSSQNPEFGKYYFIFSLRCNYSDDCNSFYFYNLLMIYMSDFGKQNNLKFDD